MRKERTDWRGSGLEKRADHLVFLDESSVNIDLTRRYGRAIGKTRIRGHAPLSTPRAQTVLGSVRLNGQMTHTTYTGGTTGQRFLEYLKDSLIPISDWISHCHNAAPLYTAQAMMDIINKYFWQGDFNMWIRVQVQIEAQKLSFEIKSNGLYQLCGLQHIIELQDEINSIFILKDMIIIITEDRDFRHGYRPTSYIKDNRQINNIDAYDWQGNHLWNIGDIVGDIKRAFDGGGLTTKASVQQDNRLLDVGDCSSDLFYCIADARRFLIDPIQKSILEIKCGKW